jgi:hypothetical protein
MLRVALRLPSIVTVNVARLWPRRRSLLLGIRSVILPVAVSTRRACTAWESWEAVSSIVQASGQPAVSRAASVWSDAARTRAIWTTRAPCELTASRVLALCGSGAVVSGG